MQGSIHYSQCFGPYRTCGEESTRGLEKGNLVVGRARISVRGPVVEGPMRGSLDPPLDPPLDPSQMQQFSKFQSHFDKGLFAGCHVPEPRQLNGKTPNLHTDKA